MNIKYYMLQQCMGGTSIHSRGPKLGQTRSVFQNDSSTSFDIMLDILVIDQYHNVTRWVSYTCTCCVLSQRGSWVFHQQLLQLKIYISSANTVRRLGLRSMFDIILLVPSPLYIRTLFYTLYIVRVCHPAMVCPPCTQLRYPRVIPLF